MLKSKLALAAVAALCIAAPALAQSFVPEAGSGNIVAGGQTTAQTAQAHRSGLNAYAMVPRQAATGAATGPTVNGGGSAGYNELIQSY